MDSVEDYARQWAKREEDLDTLSEWVKNVRLLKQIRIKNSVGLCALALHQSLNTQMLLDICLSSIANAIASADKAPCNIVFVCKSHYIHL